MMRRLSLATWVFSLLSMLVFAGVVSAAGSGQSGGGKPAAVPAATTPRRPAAVMGGIAGNQPYFYKGSFGQQWASKHTVGFRQIPFTIRIIRGDGRRIIRYPYDSRSYYSYGYDAGYYPGYYDSSRYASYSTGYPQPAVIYQPVIVAAPPAPGAAIGLAGAAPEAAPRQPVDGWALLARGQVNDAVGQFALDANKGDKHANIGYAFASALRGQHGQAIWAMRKAAGELGEHFPFASDKFAASRDRIAPLILQYESFTRAGGAGLSKSDANFMLAAIHLLEGDTAAAKQAINKASESGDAEASTKALSNAIARKSP